MLAPAAHDPVDLLQAARAGDREALGGALAAAHSSPSERLARRERAVLLADAIKALPADYAEVIILRHLEGLSLADAAARMGRSLDSVRKLWVRGIARLRERLAEPELGDTP